MKMLCFKFHQNRPIKEEFDFFEGGQGTPMGKGILIHKFLLDGKHENVAFQILSKSHNK